MTLTKVQEQDIPLLHRKKVLLKMEFPKKPTPSEAEVKKQVATTLKAQENTLVIKKIDQKFGENTAEITVYQYKDEKTLQEIEPQKKKKGEAKDGEKSEAKE